MNKQLLNSILGFVAGCLIVAGAGAGYWYWLQAQKQTPPKPPQTVEPAPTTRDAAARTPQQAMKPVANQPAQVTPTKIAMKREIAGGGIYTPGQPVDVTITLEADGTDPVRALGIEEHIPAGWRYEGVIDGIRPDIPPRNPESQTLEFAWFNVPTFPASFTYRLIAGPGGGPAAINGETIFRTSGPELRSGEVASNLDLAGAQISAAPNAPSIPITPNTPPVQEKRESGYTITSDFALSFNGQDAGYKPGAEMPLETLIDFAGADTITAMAVKINLPQGWRFKAITGGEQPAVPPKEGAQGEIAFVWITIPKFPAATQFTLIAPESAAGPQNLLGQIIYRTSGEELRSAEVEVMIQPVG